ncbi:MAG: peptide deformylase, partial [Sphingobacterium thalpophilum]
MKLPIIAYGDSVLRKKGTEITKDYQELSNLIANMFETMYGAHGIGLAAPQVGLSVRLFIIDATSFAEDEPALKDFKKIFINAKILEESGNKWSFNEGCLSIPDIREDIDRHETL